MNPRCAYRGRLAWVVLAALVSAAAPAAEPPRPLDPALAGAFAARVTERHRLDRKWVDGVLRQARVLPDVLAAMQRPAESKPWHQYRPIFVNERRIADGAAFWKAAGDEIARAADRFGVDPAVVVAIIGVETLYGQRAGSTRVVDALVTLGFHYPRRAEFFQRELEEFLVLAREDGVDPLRTKGSYAGAMGIPQFIPSSYRAYAVDFDADGRRDLIGSRADAIGSVASYLAEHGWRRGEPVVVPAKVRGEAWKPLAAAGSKPSVRLSEARRLGVTPSSAVAGDPSVALVELDAEAGPEHWLGLQNFYVVTRYNRSQLYAMAVVQLAEAIRARTRKGGG